MKLADIVGGKVVIHPDMLMVPPFKKLWDSFKDKDLATKYLWYIVLKNKHDSPYVESMYTEDIEATLKEDMFGNKDYEIPQVVLDAEEAWRRFDYTLALDMLEGLLGKLQDAAKYYKTSKGAELDLDSIKKLTDGAKNMSGVIKSIMELKAQVIAQEIDNTKIRGGAELNPFEIPKNNKATNII